MTGLVLIEDEGEALTETQGLVGKAILESVSPKDAYPKL